VKDGGSGKLPKRNHTRYLQETLSMKDIGDLDDIINDLWKLISRPLTDPEFYLRIRVQPLHGIVLHGPPGCGKTMPVKSIAREVGIPLMAISALSIRRYYSEPEKKLCERFEEACEKAPCIIFMDEIDTKTPDRKCPEGGMERRFVAQILTWIDNITF